ncbi:hypothetical protein DU833_21490 [Salmonella enterica subsp. enterica serovar Chester]|uniref:Uncharacterized protein n=1 Tax=Salmonella enterica subsp. enterica serovar Chester TaxID=149386 RepID=A0A5W7EQD2_SALET|nr:hypothetical protein [Salmonella enterica subsp. enterica serovar Chester]EBR0309973.1 hypothetical protein [Salmonella enterica subsp. enterica serovar Chester]EBX7357591.1 hypothetical protein [Salmonella enterica subsp. enterica serovar Chester]EBY2313227.1 hypothetical protein [Salmonella enterica subsp. enterica serovar Chester]ECA9651108.1 hypothetical protein [Salmonella enterica subsp. enterica serovar Chester]
MIFLVRKNCLSDDRVKRSVTHSERFFPSRCICPGLMAVNAAQRFLAALLLRSVALIWIAVQS